MAYTYFSRNGKILPIEEAVAPLSRVEYSYGFGVYENIRLSKGKIYFLEEHCQRLMESARIIELDHAFTVAFVTKALKDLAAKNQAETCNLKILLIGGPAKEDATLDILCLNPLFPDRKLYKDGVKCVTYHYERQFPQAKSLNMMPSYLAYRQAKRAGAYEALLINRDGCVAEGTRANFFAIQGRTIISPPAADILLGVTRQHVLEVAAANGFETTEQQIKLADLDNYDGAFITSTSSKILPVRTVDDRDLGQPAPAIKELMLAFDQYLRSLDD